MKVKELKECLAACSNDFEVKAIRDGDIPGSESHQVEGAYVICRETGDFKSLDAVYLVWDEA